MLKDPLKAMGVAPNPLSGLTVSGITGPFLPGLLLFDSSILAT
jgi:hypothetical protein